MVKGHLQMSLSLLLAMADEFSDHAYIPTTFGILYYKTGIEVAPSPIVHGRVI